MNTLTSHIIALSLLALVFSSACMRSSRVATEAALGSYRVSIRPTCQSTSTTAIDHFANDGSSSIRDYEFKCDDTMISIRDNMLSVNGKSYGTLSNGDRITVVFGKVRVNSEVRAEGR